ncbi:GNAT family N-acetyltransferase [Paeniglutamicibacter psychrophenolicus]|uniref:Ribosomal protein S18 acetylase RimI-like enzyme n=1 Tax=Paeniglutamicibacter psychrophenolicus TaxID=257454 RepID=A0ABS4WFV8_9MICC|nr:GNAT family N-acetyltransferase [Paeniglutamicibacter psychrophenolicus]MBP2375089.1 ribosomal protein S18 acetylase RimI-like enzyme [Paeniglutamicibacter psychrophenolicus]
MTPTRIRSPRPEDAAALAELHLETWAETYAGVFPESAWGEEARTGRIRMWNSICTAPRPGDSFALAERDGRLVGLAGAGASQDAPAPQERQLWFIYLLASEHGSGTGQGLLDAVLGKDPASLWVLEANARAVAFYARNGFVPDGTRKPSGYEGAGDEIRMVR